MTRDEELALQAEFIRKHGVKKCEPGPLRHRCKKDIEYEEILVVSALYGKRRKKPIMAPPRACFGNYRYIYLPKHPYANNYGKVYEHRLVAEYHHGRMNNLDYHRNNAHVVHHINGDKGDNRPENLCILTRKQHTELHSCAYVTIYKNIGINSSKK